MLSSAGLPLLNGFVGEFTILQGAFRSKPGVGGVCGSGRGLRRGLFAVALPANHARADHQRQESAPTRSQHAGDRGVPSTDRMGDLDRRIPQALFRHSWRNPCNRSWSACGPATIRVAQACSEPSAVERSSGEGAMNQFTTPPTISYWSRPDAGLFGCAISVRFPGLSRPAERKYLLFFCPGRGVRRITACGDSKINLAAGGPV